MSQAENCRRNLSPFYVLATTEKNNLTEEIWMAETKVDGERLL